MEFIQFFEEWFNVFVCEDVVFVVVRWDCDWVNFYIKIGDNVKVVIGVFYCLL